MKKCSLLVFSRVVYTSGGWHTQPTTDPIGWLAALAIDPPIEGVAAIDAGGSPGGGG